MSTGMKVGFLVTYVLVSGTQALMNEGVKALVLDVIDQKLN